jgi:hypothetical protein
LDKVRVEDTAAVRDLLDAAAELHLIAGLRYAANDHLRRRIPGCRMTQSGRLQPHGGTMTAPDCHRPEASCHDRSVPGAPMSIFQCWSASSPRRLRNASHWMSPNSWYSRGWRAMGRHCSRGYRSVPSRSVRCRASMFDSAQTLNVGTDILIVGRVPLIALGSGTLLPRGP